MRESEDIERQKQALRADMLARRKSIVGEEAAASDVAIAQRVVTHPLWQAAQTVFLYVSVKGEPDTRALLNAAWQSGKTVCVPKCLGGGIMEAKRVSSMVQLRPSAFGLLEPADATPTVAPTALDLVITPCVAADETAHRLGNGGGYYDRYLPQTTCPALCLCRDALVVPRLPQEAFDVPVYLVATETRLIAKTDLDDI